MPVLVPKALRLDELLAAHRSCDLHHAVVAGICYYFGKCLCTVSSRIRSTLYGRDAADSTEVFKTVVGKGVRFGDLSLLQRC